MKFFIPSLFFNILPRKCSTESKFSMQTLQYLHSKMCKNIHSCSWYIYHYTSSNLLCCDDMIDSFIPGPLLLISIILRFLSIFSFRDSFSTTDFSSSAFYLTLLVSIFTIFPVFSCHHQLT